MPTYTKRALCLGCRAIAGAPQGPQRPAHRSSTHCRMPIVELYAGRHHEECRASSSAYVSWSVLSYSIAHLDGEGGRSAKPRRLRIAPCGLMRCAGLLRQSSFSTYLQRNGIGRCNDTVHLFRESLHSAGRIIGHTLLLALSSVRLKLLKFRLCGCDKNESEYPPTRQVLHVVPATRPMQIRLRIRDNNEFS